MEVSQGSDWNRTGEPTATQPNSSCNFRSYNQQQCGVWILSAGLITEKFQSVCWYMSHQRWSEGFSSLLQENSLLSSKSETGRKLLTSKSRVFAAQFKLKDESWKTAVTCPSWWIWLQCAQTRWGEWISILQCSHTFPLQKPACLITQAMRILFWIWERIECYGKNIWKKQKCRFWGLHTLCLDNPHKHFSTNLTKRNTLHHLKFALSRDMIPKMWICCCLIQTLNQNTRGWELCP